MKPIKEIVSGRPLFSIGRDKSVLETVDLMAEKNVGALPVVENDRLVGVFSERDVITRVLSKGLNPATTSIADVMTSKIVVADENEGYESCLRKMQQAHCRHLPIVSGDKLVGMVSLRDMLMMELDEKERNLEYLQSYIYTIPPGAAKRYETGEETKQ
jgi:CBS domain-containing protein